MLGEQEFQKKADESLQALCSRLAEASEDYDFDVDMNSGALAIEFEEPKEKFVVSPNSPVRQIWVSAHVRSFKLDWEPARGAFVLPETGQTLEELMVEAVAKRIPGFAL
jgi:iron donor protein CyaY